MPNSNEVMSLKDIEQILESCRLLSSYKTPLERLKEHKLPAATASVKQSSSSTTTVATSVSVCPYCKATLNAATSAQGGASPIAGDLSVCLTCAEILVFGNDLKLNKPDFKVYQKIMEDPSLLASLEETQAAVRKVRTAEAKK